MGSAHCRRILIVNGRIFEWREVHMLSRWSRWIGLALIGGGVAVTACGDSDGGDGGDAGDAGEGADAGAAGKKTGGSGGMANAGRGGMGTAGSTGGSGEGGSQPSGGTQSKAGSGGEGDAPSGGTSGSGNTGGTTTAGTSGTSGSAGEGAMGGSGGDAGGEGGSGGSGGDAGGEGGSGGDMFTGGAGGDGGSGGATEPVIAFTVTAGPNEIPLAPGGINWATLQISSESSVPLSITLTASAPNGVTVDPASQVIQLPVNGTVDADVTLMGTDVSTGTGGLMLVATPSPGGETKAISKTLGILFSDDMARNTMPTTSEYPKAFASSSQANQGPALAFDNNAGTFWVSSGMAAGEGPTVSDPEWLGVDFGGAVDIQSVRMRPRDNRGPRDYTVQVSDDGEVWENVGEPVLDAAMTGEVATSLPAPVEARYVRLHMTRSYDPGSPPGGACPTPCLTPRNAQVHSLVVQATVVP
jgi:hypothetical protein